MSDPSGPGDISAQRRRLTASLENLQNLITLIPETAPLAAADGPLVRNFGDLDVDSEEGPYYALDRAWVRTFQVSAEEQESLICRGQHGIIFLYNCLVWLATLPTMVANNGLFLLAERVDALNRLVARVIYHVYRANDKGNPTSLASSDTSFTPKASAVNGSGAAAVLGKRKEAPSEDTTTPQAQARSSKTANEQLHKPSAAKGKHKQGAATEKNKGQKKPKRARKAAPKSDDDDDGSGSSAHHSDSADDEPLRRGRPAHKQTWAIAHFVPLRYSANGKSLWKWKCNFCNTYRTSPRTPGCKDFDKEAPELRRPQYASNFIRHLSKECKKIPDNSKFEAWQARHLEGTRQGVSNGETQANAAPEELGGVVNGESLQRGLMSGFVARGRENPEKQVTRKGFREFFVKGIVEDDLPYTFGEGNGMTRCFTYILPKGYKVPNRTMVRRDLILLHDKINEKLNRILKGLTSKVSIASDAWSSKNCVFAFSGLGAFWITENWALVSCPLNLLPLGGDHTGSAAARLLHRALKKRGLIKKLMGSTADNASSNGKMNRVLARRIARDHQIYLDPDDIQVGCAGHVVNLGAQDFLHALGLAPNPDIEDYYVEARNFPLAFQPEQDPDHVAHAAKALEEAQDEASAAAGSGTSVNTKPAADEDDSEDSATESESDTEDNTEDAGEESRGVSRTKPAKAQKRAFTPVDKLHAVVVDILRSEGRRKRMRCFTRQLCDKDARHLVPIRSMPVRWNSTYAEIERGLKLRPAINQWIEQLDHGLTGKKAQAARTKKAKWYLSPQDWEMLADICTILKPFHNVTLQLSMDGVPTLPMVLPLYKYLEKHLQDTKASLKKPQQASLRLACSAAFEKIDKHLNIALISKYPLLGAVLHPYVRIAYFKNTDLWDSDIAVRARALLEELYDEYAERLGTRSTSDTAAAAPSTDADQSSAFACAIAAGRNCSRASSGDEPQSEVDRYVNNAYPCTKVYGALEWWRDHAKEFPVLSVIARDVLAIPGVSIAIERLFSSCRHTLTDARSSMLAETASTTIVTKEWLKRGLGDDIAYLEDVTIHE